VIIKFNHWLGHPWPDKRKRGWIYARVFGSTIYFENDESVVLSLDHKARYKYAGLLAHEMHHVWQHENIPHFRFRYFIASLKIFLKTLSVYEAYYQNPYEEAARLRADVATKYGLDPTQKHRLNQALRN
jgi:hypothetical protein